MSRRTRASAFLLEPERFRYDRAVLAMSDAARGCYAMLFMAAWSQEEPGVLVDDDRVLANLAMTSLEEWVKVRDQVAAAFDVLQRPGYWIQRGMVRTVEAQDLYINRKRLAGSKGGKTKRDNRISSTTKAGATDEVRSNDPSSATENGVAPARDRFGFGFGSGSENPENLTLGHGSVADTGQPDLDDPDADLPVPVWFAEVFWPAYPRKVKRPDAERAMVALFRRTPRSQHDDLGDAIMAGLERYRTAVNGKDGEYVSHPSTWIRNRRWEDES